MNILIVLKFVCPLIVMVIVYFLNREMKKRRLEKESKRSIPRYEFGDISKDVEKLKKFPRLISQIGIFCLEQKKLDITYRICKIILGEEIIAAILYSWPSYLSTSPYSQIYCVEVLKKYRGLGYLRSLMNLVISETNGISTGIRIDIKDPAQKEIFIKKFGFKDLGTYLLLDYGDRS